MKETQIRAREVKQWLAENSLIIDCETTGLGKSAEVVQIGVIDCHQNVLMDRLVKPSIPIPTEASAVHGIRDADVWEAPTWDQIHDEFCRILEGRHIAIYNAAYDVRVLRQTMRKHGLRPPNSFDKARCAMVAYADFRANRRNARWLPLNTAARQQGVRSDGRVHSAIPDCLLTRGVMEAMARAATN